MDIFTLQKQNNTLKQNLDQSISQFHNLEPQLTSLTLNLNSHSPITAGLKQASNAIDKLKSIMEAMDKILVHRQVEENQGVESRGVVRMVEKKLGELRVQVHGKEACVEDLLFQGEDEGLGYCEPKLYQFRKLYIELLHKQKVSKLLTNLSQLKQQLTPTPTPKPPQTPINNPNEITHTHTTPTQKHKQSHTQILTYMLAQIAKQDRLHSELQQQYQVYGGIYQLVCRENLRLVGDIGRKAGR